MIWMYCKSERWKKEKKSCSSINVEIEDSPFGSVVGSLFLPIWTPWKAKKEGQLVTFGVNFI
jgi:hypothetical protein